MRLAKCFWDADLLNDGGYFRLNYCGQSGAKLLRSTHLRHTYSDASDAAWQLLVSMSICVHRTSYTQYPLSSDASCNASSHFCICNRCGMCSKARLKYCRNIMFFARLNFLRVCETLLTDKWQFLGTENSLLS